MASRNRYMARAGHRYFGSTERGYAGGGDISLPSSDFEFQESDVWGGTGAGTYPVSTNLSGSPPDITKQRPMSGSRMIGSGGGCRKQQHQQSKIATVGSLPVNIPDWSRILRDESRRGSYAGGEEDEEEVEEFGNGGGVRVPPHEMVARKQRMSSFSVYEGVGRTLKGRDLSRVRNAIWAQTGFQD